MSFKKYQNFYLELKKFELKPSTFESYEVISRKHLSHFETFEVEQIKISDIRKFQLHLYSENLSPKTIKNILGHINTQMLFKVYGKFIKNDKTDTTFSFLGGKK